MHLAIQSSLGPSMVIQLNMETNDYGIYNNFDFVKQYNLCI